MVFMTQFGIKTNNNEVFEIFFSKFNLTSKSQQ